MAQTGKNKLRRWEFPAGSGIRIREIINRYAGRDGGLSYRVTIPRRLAGERRFKQFPALDAAETWAKDQNGGINRDGQKHFLLSPAEREDALAALAVLNGTGLTLTEAAKLGKSQHHPPAGTLKVAEAIGKLLAQKEAENLRDRSVRDLRNRLAIFEQRFGERSVAEIARTEIEEWLRDLRGISDKSAAGLSARSKKNYLITVRTFFNWAISKGYRASENPAATISTPKIDWKTPSILTPQEAKRLITAAQTEQKGRLLATVALGLFAGIRTSEITKLDWSAVDLDERIITIGPLIAKKRRLRVLELMPNCVAWLRTVPIRSGRIGPGKFNTRWAEFVKEAGFPDWGEKRTNAMRHSFGSYQDHPKLGLGVMPDYLESYATPEGLDIPKLLNDDHFSAIRLLFQHGSYLASMKLLASFIDTVAYLDRGDVPGAFVKWLDEYADLKALGVSPAQLWELRNSLLHMSNLDSRRVLGGKEQRVAFFVGPRGTPPMHNNGITSFNLLDLIFGTAEAITKWLSSFPNDPRKLQAFVERYDRVVREAKMKSASAPAP